MNPDDVVRHRWSESDRFVPRVVVRPLQRFVRTSTGGALLMLTAAVVALIWANSPWQDSYFSLWSTPVELAVGDIDALSGHSLQEWVNDGAMTFFFLLVALEIKRELVSGELRDPRTAALPVIAAVGGMVVPAGIYLALNAGSVGVRGWGIPTATDIAFAVAVVAVAGSRLPTSARVFLLSLAIVDDLGAIVLIAVAYTDSLSPAWLVAALLTILLAWGLQRSHVRSPTPYVALGAFCWFSLLEAGVHPTLAGVAFGLLTPVWAFHDPHRFPERARALSSVVEQSVEDGQISEDEQPRIESALRDVRRLAVDSASPVDRVEHAIGPWVTYAVVPVFALANAGVVIPGNLLGALGSPVALGILLGLVVGKPVGIVVATWLATRTRIARLPAGLRPAHVLALSVCAGIGFTVAIFIADLAFADPHLVSEAKLAILAASLVAAALGAALLRLVAAKARA